MIGRETALRDVARDRGSLAVAVAIQRENPVEVDLDAIERWSEREGSRTGHDEFRARLIEGTDEC